jgi:hypothetical protein
MNKNRGKKKKYIYIYIYIYTTYTIELIYIHLSQEVVQLARTTSNEAEVSSSNLSPPSCVDMSKKKKKKNFKPLSKGLIKRGYVLTN